HRADVRIRAYRRAVVQPRALRRWPTPGPACIGRSSELGEEVRRRAGAAEGDGSVRPGIGRRVDRDVHRGGSLRTGRSSGYGVDIDRKSVGWGRGEAPGARRRTTTG